MDTPKPDAHAAGETSPMHRPALASTRSEPMERTVERARGRPVEQHVERPLGCFGRIAAVAVLVVSGAYLVNPGFGFLEFLPDNVPGIGNLDEAFFTLAFVSALGALGVRLPFLRRR